MHGHHASFARRTRQAVASVVGALALTLVSIGVPTGRLVAQQTTVLIIGVSDFASGAALEGADILLPALGRSARTDALGEARITGVPVGDHRIRVRFLGYAAADTTLSFQGDTTGMVFRLTRAVMMETVEVKAAGPSRLREFDARRAAGLGRYMTLADLEKESNREFGVVAATRFPGLRVVHDGDGRPHIASMRGSCGVGSSPSNALLVGARSGGSGGRGAATSGGTGTGAQGSAGNGPIRPPEELPIGTAYSAGSCTPSKYCLLQVYLDGVLLDEADFDIVTTWDLAGVEYYSGASIPVRYRISGSACGVMLLWSK